LSLSIYEELCSLYLYDSKERSILEVELKGLEKIERSTKSLLFKNGGLTLAEIIFFPVFKILFFLKSQEEEKGLLFSPLKIKYLMDYQQYRENEKEGLYGYSFWSDDYTVIVDIKKYEKLINIELHENGKEQGLIYLCLEKFIKVTTTENALFIWKDDKDDCALMIELRPHLAIYFKTFKISKF
jgi:hypothetical protein